MSAHLDDESRAHFDRVQALLGDVGVPFTAQPAARARASTTTRAPYSSGSTDRLGAQSAICSGGRYDGLVAQLGGRETPAVGWALGIERIVELHASRGHRGAGEAPPDAHFVAAGEAERRFGFKLAERLRDRLPGLKLSIGAPAAGFKAQLRRADKSGARVALIVGEAELAAGKVSFKPLREDKPQQLVTVEECIDLAPPNAASA